MWLTNTVINFNDFIRFRNALYFLWFEKWDVLINVIINLIMGNSRVDVIIILEFP